MSNEDFRVAFERETTLDVASFQSGFAFAQLVYEAAAPCLPPAELIELLKQIAAGKVTLVPSAAEAFRNIENQLQAPVSESFRDFVTQLTTGKARRESEQWHKWASLAALRVFGEVQTI
jgi:hypothetical protein